MTPTPKLAFTSLVATLAFLGLAILGWGGFAAFFSNPARIALTVVVFALTGAALLSPGNLSSGEREDRGNRWVLLAFALIGLAAGRLSPGLHGPQRILDPRRRRRPLARRRSVRRRRRAADLAGLCARPPVQRIGRHPARAYARHQRHLRHHPPSQLSGLAGQLAGLGAGVSFGGGCAARRVPDPAAGRAHPRRRGAAALAVRR